MSNDNNLLVDAPLVLDSDAEDELGSLTTKSIADEALHDSRLLIALGAVEAKQFDKQMGGAVELICTFHPGHNSRFLWARVILNLKTPAGIQILDLAPREVRENEAVKFTVDDKGSLGVKYVGVELGAGADVRTEYAVYHCAVQGSGAGTALARWDFSENPSARAGIGREQSLVLSLPTTGSISGTINVTARLARPGLAGGLDALYDMVLGPKERAYPVSFTIPDQPEAKESGLGRFLKILG